MPCRYGHHTTPSGNARHRAEGATQMIHHSASSQPRPAARGIPRIRRWATGLAVAATASLAGAPAALAVPLPPPGGPVTDPVPRRPRRPPQRPPTSRCGPSSPSWPLRSSCPSAPRSSRWRWNTGTAPAAPRPPRPARQPAQPRQNPRPGRARSSAATSTRPAMTCTGPTAGKGSMALRQPPGVILNGCRTVSPSATWRTDPRIRQVPGAAPLAVSHGQHRRPGSRRGDGGVLRPGEPSRNP